MAGSVSKGLKTTFVLYAFFAGVLGLIYLVLPVAWGKLVGWPPGEAFDHRIIGATFLAFGFGSWLAARRQSWAEVCVVVQMNALWTGLATLLMVWGLVSGDLPTLGWVYVVAVGGFALAFISGYARHSSG